MLPILTKPLLQYAVEEALAANLENMAIVTGRGKRAIEDHFDNSIELESQLQGTSKEHYLHDIKDVIDKALNEIENDLDKQILFFEKERKFNEAKRIKERTEFDIEMINEIGYCSGVENYSRYFDKRKPGKRPFCLIDYFPDDFLMFIDESHVTIPQIRAMWGGDRSRKMNLVDYGFRLPSALDNRPLNFQEFESLIDKVVFVGATP